ncbi:MAG: 3-phosphoshikimate 1-carboxyvinyltransferase [Rikenellaceae bacterium]|nr:3-phosphoshikimate 1-carboxyvinyltransferase [Rikenellaceae bacterium]
MIKEIKRSAVRGAIVAPASKSFAQRAIAAALLADGTTTLENMTLCEDTEAALDTAKRLGAEIVHNGRTYIIKGGLRPQAEVLNIGEAGLSTRLFTPIASLYDEPLTITGRGSILKRPISMIEKPLRDLGVEVKTTGGYLPVTVCGPLRGGEIEVDGSMSSQFITGLLMALPLAGSDSVLNVGVLNSKPYIDMTIQVAKSFGVDIVNGDYKKFTIKSGQKYNSIIYNVEGDWSGASCILVAGAIAGEVQIGNLDKNSAQADKEIIAALKKAGADVVGNGNTVIVRKNTLHGFEFDATDCPDLFPALAVLAVNCMGVTTIKGTKRLTNKESDRAETVAYMLSSMGISVDISEADLMKIKGGAIKSATVDSFNDHRIAMASAVAGLVSDGRIVIKGAEAVNKSYPSFWDDLASLVNIL